MFEVCTHNNTAKQNTMRREKQLRWGKKKRRKAIFGKSQAAIPKNNIASIQGKTSVGLCV